MPAPGVDVQHYDLAVRLDPATRALDARAVLTVAHPDTLGTLVLTLDGLTVDALRVEGRAVAVRRAGAVLRVPLSRGQAASRVEIAYHGTPTAGLYARHHGGQRLVFTDSWPDAGRGWLPGVHHPSDPATFALTLTLPRGYEAAASGTRVALDTLAGGVRYRWRLDVPAPAYTFAFAVGDFAVIEDTVGDTLPVRYILPEEEVRYAAALRRTPEALAFFGEMLGPYPFGEYEAVAVPIRYAGMENAGTAFLQTTLFSDAALAEAVQIHELAHQWFGNRVPIARWSDLWLSEGTATYLTTLFYEHADGLDAARRRWVELARLRGGNTALVPPSPVDPRTHLTWVPYEKGAAVLHLLRRTLGDDVFFAALRETYRRHAGRPLSTEAFQTILEATSGRRLGEFFDVWVYGEAVPTLATHWDSDARMLSWQLAGDGGTLAGVPFELKLQQGTRSAFVRADAGQVVLARWGTAQPTVEPVGVLLRVE